MKTAPQHVLATVDAVDDDALDWARRWRAGAAPEALLALAFERWHRRVHRLAHRICANASDAEEITQETFETFARTLPRLQDPQQAAAYLSRCAVRAALARVKRARWWRNWVMSSPPREAIAPGPDHESALAARRLLDGLAPETRTAIVLRFVEGCSLEETAALMNVSVSTAQRHLRRGLTTLRARAGHDDDLTEAVAALEPQEDGP